MSAEQEIYQPHGHHPMLPSLRVSAKYYLTPRLPGMYKYWLNSVLSFISLPPPVFFPGFFSFFVFVLVASLFAPLLLPFGLLCLLVTFSGTWYLVSGFSGSLSVRVPPPPFPSISPVAAVPPVFLLPPPLCRFSPLYSLFPSFLSPYPSCRFSFAFLLSPSHFVRFGLLLFFPGLSDITTGG